MPRLAAQLALAALALLAPAPPASAQRRQARHFFGPPVVGFGVGILSVHRRFPVAASIVSRRASRSYSHQYHYQATPVGEHGYQTSRLGWIFVLKILPHILSTFVLSVTRKVTTTTARPT